MPKEIKQYYQFMNLSYSSTIEQVEEREKVMIKILRAKAIKKNKSNNEKIDQVVMSANGIIGYIEKNGVPNIKDNMFNTSKTSIFYEILMLFAVLMALGFSIYSLI